MDRFIGIIKNSLDTQHGRFEKLNKKGKHMGEVDMCLNEKVIKILVVNTI